MIPTRRMLWLALLPLAIILLGLGMPAAVVVAEGLFAVLVVAFLLDGILASKRPRLHFERLCPLQLHVDQPHRIAWKVENHGPFAVDLRLGDTIPAAAKSKPDVLEFAIAARSRMTVEYELTPRRRGDSSFGDLVYRVRGPLGLAWRQKRLPAALMIRCFPHLANWKAAELAERQALMRQIGSHRYRWRGAGTVFESLRDYSPQDDIRWIDWKATARHGRPISRNFEVDRHQQVLVLLDASRAMTTYCGRRTKFDAVLEAAVLLARSALDQGDSFGLTVFSDHLDDVLPPRRERIQLTKVMEHLYEKQPRLVEPNYELALTQTAKRNLRRSLVVIFTDVLVQESARRLLTYLRVLTSRHLPLIVTIADETLEKWELTEPSTARDFYRVGVANDLMHERTVLLEELRRNGAVILDSPADQVAPRAIECYFELKRRLRL